MALKMLLKINESAGFEPASSSRICNTIYAMIRIRNLGEVLGFIIPFICGTGASEHPRGDPVLREHDQRTVHESR